MKLSELWVKEVLGALPKESRAATDEELHELYGDSYTTFTRNGYDMVKVTHSGELDPDINFVFPRRMPVKDGKIIDLTNICIECAYESDKERQIKALAMCGAYDADANEFWITYLTPTHLLLSISTMLFEGCFKMKTDEAEGTDNAESVFAQRKVSSDGRTEICHLLLKE